MHLTFGAHQPEIARDVMLEDRTTQRLFDNLPLWSCSDSAVQIAVTDDGKAAAVTKILAE